MPGYYRFYAVASLAFLLLLLSFNLSASSIEPSDSDVQYIRGSSATGQIDMLKVKQSNASGISINRFDKFLVIDRPLRLINVPGQIQSFDGNSSAGLIIIIAEHLKLENRIEVVGPATDIIFITEESDGALSCVNCRFSNFNRITLAAARSEGPIANNIANVGELRTTESGSISINNLQAPGAVAVDVVAHSVQLMGQITTHVAANKSFFGGYKEDLNGKYAIGAGSVNLVIGEVWWQYQNQSINKVKPNSNSLITLNGSVRAVKFKVTAGSLLDINTDIDTRSDVLSAVRYKGDAHIVDEGLEIQSFGYKDVKISANLTSRGKISIKSNGSVKIKNSSVLKAENIELIAEDDVDNRGQLDSTVIEVSGREVRNRGGILEASEEVSVYAGNNIYNEFGGRILGDSVNLQAGRFVRNGSRTPYIPIKSDVDALLDYGWNDIDDPHPWKIGTFYRDDVYVDVRAGSNWSKPEDSTAKIISNRIAIKTRGFENINPYWKRIPKNSNSFTFDTKYINQVVLSAENSIDISADYVLNSSAIIRQNSPKGEINISAGVISNERYRTLMGIFQKVDRYLAGGVSDPIIVTKNFAYSPPGVITSFGDFNANALIGFINNVSYFEVFGDAVFGRNTAKVKDIGIEGNDGFKSVTELVGISDCQSGSPGYRAGEFSTYYIDCEKYGLRTYDKVDIINSARTDSLFFVHGSLSGKQVDFLALQNDFLFQYIKNKLINEYSRNGNRVGESSWNAYGNRVLRADVIFDSANPNSIALESFYNSEKYSGEDGVRNKYSVERAEYSLIDRLQAAVNDFKKVIADLFDEVMGWWD